MPSLVKNIPGAYYHIFYSTECKTAKQYIKGTRNGAVVDSDTMITTLDDTTVIKLDFTIPEAYLGVLANGMNVTAQSPAYPDRNFNGTVTAISSRVDPDTRTLTIRAQIPNPDQLLKPGMLLTVDLVKDRSQSLIIPEEAMILEKAKKFALVVAVLFLFLGSLRATLVPAVTVPVSLIATFAVLSIMDFTINLLTLLAMILAIGMVVDDAIVVLENIFRRIQLGEPPLLAALKGARQVGFAVVATTLVLVAVFVPITFMQGNTGRLFSEFAIALAGAVCLSSLVALTLSPMMCSRILKPRPLGISSKQPRLTSLQEAAAKRYGRLLVAMMQHK
jgi:multidrug efflux pump subunit AcrB